MNEDSHDHPALRFYAGFLAVLAVFYCVALGIGHLILLLVK